MRVYLPATMLELRTLLQDGALSGGVITAFAVTPGLRQWYSDDDIEELEYAAMLEAARASLRLIDSDPQAPPRRVVVAADVADAAIEVRDDIDRGVVRIADAVPMTAVASVHVDGQDAEAAVQAAAQAIVRADLGDEAAQELVDDVEGYELSWYATQEIAALVELM